MEIIGFIILGVIIFVVKAGGRAWESSSGSL